MDVKTRWNSTHDMILMTLKQKAALKKMANIDTETKKLRLHLHEDEWELLGLVADHLSRFKKATVILSGS